MSGFGRSWEEIAQPVDAVACHSCCFTMPIMAIDSLYCDNASARLAVQQEGKKDTYSIIGSVPLTTTCKPCATASTGSAQKDAAAARGPIAQRLVPSCEKTLSDLVHFTHLNPTCSFFSVDKLDPDKC
jgi:hypothetical protein